MNAKELVDALKDMNMEPKAYSGRGMYGRYCVSVNVEYLGDAFDLGFDLASYTGINPGAPTSDNMGSGFVLYWPNMDWPS